MKRLFLILTAIIGLSVTASAQTQFGLEAGAIINKMSFSKDVFISEAIGAQKPQKAYFD